VFNLISVLRVELSDREASKRLDKGLENLVEFWSHLPGKHADVMVSPDLKVNPFFEISFHNLTYPH